MAVTAGTVWRIRPSGSDGNGGGFDPTVASPGTDFSQQDAAQIIYTDLVIDAATNTNCTSAGHPFASSHVGNVLNITSGTGFTVQRVVINSVSGGVATCNGSLGTLSSTGGHAKLGGGLTLSGSAFAIGSAVQPGNTVYVLGAGGNPDYTTTSFFTPTNGTNTGVIHWIGQGTTPLIQTNGLLFYNTIFNNLSNINFIASGNNNATVGIVNINQGTITGCYINTNSETSTTGLYLGNSGIAIGNRISGGSSSPSLSATSYGINVFGYACVVSGNFIEYALNDGILDNGQGETRILNNIVYGCAGNGITTGITITNGVNSLIVGNTIDSNQGNGINLTSAAGISADAIYNNIITNHTQAGKYGLAVTDGSTATNNNRAQFCDYNVLYNNTSNYQNYGGGAHDQLVNPVYKSAGSDWTPTNTALSGTAFPPSFPGTGSTNYAYPGAIQPQAAGGGLLLPTGMNGGFGE